MALKVNYQRGQGLVSHQNPMLLSGGQQAHSYEDSLMVTPQTKRFKQDSTFGKESPFLGGEIFIPSDLDKLKKLFPLLDTKVGITKFHHYFNSDLFASNLRRC